MKSEDKISQSRRRFLETISKAGVSSALLRSSALVTGMMLNRSALAAGEFPNRVIFVYIPDGAPSGTWAPQGELGTGLSCAALAGVKQYCTPLLAVNMPGGHGNTPKCLGGDVANITLDEYLADTVGKLTPFSNLRLGVITGTNHGTMSKRPGGGGSLTYNDDPNAAFDGLFSGAVTPPAGLRRKENILDTHRASLNSLKGKLGAFELQRMQEHEASIEQMALRLADTGADNASEECKTPVFDRDRIGNLTSEYFTQMTELQADLSILAMKCGLTNVASLMYGNHQAEFSIPGLRYGNVYHQSIHGGNLDTYSEMRNALSGHLAYLIQKLADTKEADGETAMIENTMILQVTDMGDGRSHSGTFCPFMFAGGTAIMNQGTGVVCESHNDAVHTAAVAMGVANNADYPGYSNTVVPILK